MPTNFTSPYTALLEAPRDIAGDVSPTRLSSPALTAEQAGKCLQLCAFQGPFTQEKRRVEASDSFCHMLFAFLGALCFLFFLILGLFKEKRK